MTHLARRSTLLLAGVVAACWSCAAPVQAASDLDTTGGGEFVIFLSYSQAPPTVLEPGCRSTAFTVSGGSQLLVVSVTSADSTGVFSYPGPVSISGSGSSTCEDASQALAGSMTLALTSPDGSFACPSLAGAYIRAGLGVLLEWQGTCTLDGMSFEVSFIGLAAYEPLQGDGVRTPVTDASLDGALGITV